MLIHAKQDILSSRLLSSRAEAKLLQTGWPAAASIKLASCKLLLTEEGACDSAACELAAIHGLAGSGS